MNIHHFEMTAHPSHRKPANLRGRGVGRQLWRYDFGTVRTRRWPRMTERQRQLRYQRRTWQGVVDPTFWIDSNPTREEPQSDVE